MESSDDTPWLEPLPLRIDKRGLKAPAPSGHDGGIARSRSFAPLTPHALSRTLGPKRAGSQDDTALGYLSEEDKGMRLNTSVRAKARTGAPSVTSLKITLAP